MLLELLGLHGSHTTDHAWALRCVLCFLLPIEAARLVVAVLEAGGADARARVYGLRRGDAPLPRAWDDELLGEAASHACWRALTVLLTDLRATTPPWLLNLDDQIHEAASATVGEGVRLATAVHRGTHYRFGYAVLEAAATRGHLTALQWLAPRSAPFSGRVAPTRRAIDHGFFSNDASMEVIQTAARARQLHVVEWLVRNSTNVDLVLPYDEELRAVCWVERHTTARSDYYCVTSSHGINPDPGWQYHDDPPESQRWYRSLATLFARHGDLAALKQLHARGMNRQPIGPRAADAAARSGHLTVLQWLYQHFPYSFSSTCLEQAATGGHLELLQWLYHVKVPLEAGCDVQAAANGHLDVLQWLLSVDATLFTATAKSQAMTYAIRSGHMNVVRFLHEECDVAIDAFMAFTALPVCQHLDVCTYVLDRVADGMPHLDAFLSRIVHQSTLEVVQHLVLTRGLWYRGMLDAALRRPIPNGTRNLEICRFLYDHARVRARDSNTTMDEQLECRRITILSVTDDDVAVWALQCVPEMRMTTTGLRQEWDGTDSLRDAVVAAGITFRPDECRTLQWLPLWAVEMRCFDTLQQLKACDHPTLRTVETFHAITTATRDARFMLTLLPLPANAPTLRKEVVEWAAAFGMTMVLHRVFDVEAPMVQRQLLQQVAVHVGVSGHVEVADWLLARCARLTVAIDKILKQTAAVDAARCGHTRVLQWLIDHQLLRTTPPAIASMVTAAATACQLLSLQWLLTTVSVPAKLLARVLMDAVQSNRMDIVEFMTTKFAPAELSMRSDDRKWIRSLLMDKKLSSATRRADEAAATSRRLNKKRRRSLPTSTSPR